MIVALVITIVGFLMAVVGLIGTVKTGGDEKWMYLSLAGAVVANISNIFVQTLG